MFAGASLPPIPTPAPCIPPVAFHVPFAITILGPEPSLAAALNWGGHAGHQAWATGHKPQVLKFRPENCCGSRGNKRFVARWDHSHIAISTQKKIRAIVLRKFQKIRVADELVMRIGGQGSAMEQYRI
jgi:hypothetical protein